MSVTPSPPPSSPASPAPTPSPTPTPSPAPTAVFGFATPATPAPAGTAQPIQETVIDIEPSAGSAQVSGEQLTGLQRGGLSLARWVLSIIVGALVVLTAAVTSSETRISPPIEQAQGLVLKLYEASVKLPADDPKLAQARKDLESLTRQIVDAKAAERGFWMQFSQMILLNLLLPVLTAILGYVFGAQGARR